MNNVSIGGDSGITQWRERHQGEPRVEEGDGTILSASVHSASEGRALTRHTASIR